GRKEQQGHQATRDSGTGVGNHDQNPMILKRNRTNRFGGRVLSERIPLPFSSISRLLSALEGMLLNASTSTGRATPRTMTVSCWLFMKIWRCASTTRLPLPRTAITWPVRFVWRFELAAVCPVPLSCVED